MRPTRIREYKMKKTLLLVCLTLSMFATSAFAQEVRGIETRRVTYQGPRYNDIGSSYYDTYYGFEFRNLNSIKVSVDIELYQQGEKNNPDKLIDTKSIVLNPDETYVYKRESDNSFRKGNKDDGYSCAGGYHNDIHYFYVRYKAYKLQ